MYFNYYSFDHMNIYIFIFIYIYIYIYVCTGDSMGLVISGVCLALHDDKALDKVNEFIDVHNDPDRGIYVYAYIYSTYVCKYIDEYKLCIYYAYM
jgi:hypothetical protein